jgi:hypothetical protein
MKKIASLVALCAVAVLAGCGDNSASSVVSSAPASSVVATSVATDMVPVEKTIDEVMAIGAMLEKGKEDSTHIYKVTGTVLGVVDSVYGNGTIYNADFSKKISLYGATKTASALVQKDGVASFTNPKDFVYGTTFVDGDVLTLNCLVKNYNNTVEIYGVITNVDSTKNHATFTASINTPENGTAALSKSANLYIGETVEVTATPNEGYKVDTVAVNGKSLVLTDSKYTFAVSFKNEVTVSFVSTSAVVSSIGLTVDNLGLASGAYGNGVGTVGGVAFSATATGNYGNGIQMRIKDGTASTIVNTTALPYDAKNVVFAYNADKAPTDDKYAYADIVDVSFSADGTTYTETKKLSIVVGTLSYTITPAGTGFKFVKIAHTDVSGTVYFDSITINLNVGA